MEKLSFVLLPLALIVLLAGCNIEPAENAQTNSQAQMNTTPTDISSDTQEQASDKIINGQSENSEGMEENTMKITVGETIFSATLTNNSSAEALKELLLKGPLTISMSDYASMEKVGSIGTYLPTNDENITAKAGDIILYQGNSLVIYYDQNTWNFTRLGKISGVNKDELIKVLGHGDVTVTLSLE